MWDHLSNVNLHPPTLSLVDCLLGQEPHCKEVALLLESFGSCQAKPV